MLKLRLFGRIFTVMRRHLTTFALLFFSLSIFAQERPKIGLALSGGGAKSMAHIGAIRVLEEHGIRPDYITGTSMGAIIGAMYAHGYSADQIEYLLKSVNWDALLNNTLPRYRLSYLDRHSDDRYAFSLAIDSTGIQLPDAVNSGQYVLSTLARLLEPVHGDTNFADFAIPFACVATNLETGEMTLLENGDLVDALRASSAFPSIFSPHEIDGQLYVDGGIRNNLPIALLKQKGMDFIIAVDTQSPLYSADELRDVITILEQVGSYPNMEYYEEQKKLADVIIHPQLDDITITSYEYTDSIISAGECAAKEHMETWQQMGKDSLPTLTPPQPLKKIRVDSISVSGIELTTSDFVLSTLGMRPGDSVATSQLHAGMERLYGSRFYRQVDYRLYSTDRGTLLHVELDELQDREFLRLGVHYDDDFKMGVLLNLTIRNALLKNSKFSMDVVVSENPRGELSYIFNRGFIPALGFRTDFHMFQSTYYVDRTAVTEYQYTDFSSEIFAHSTLWDLYTIGGGVRLENIDISERIARSILAASNATYLNYFGFVDFDSFNRTYKPTGGFSLEGEFKVISEMLDYESFTEPISIVHLEYDQAFSFSPSFGGRTRLMGAATVGPDAPYPYSIFIGGTGENYTQHMFPFMGYRYMELYGRNALTLRADLWYEVIPNHFLTVSGNVGKLEATLDDLYSSDVLLDGYGITYGYNSPIGPLEICIQKSTNHSDLLTYIRLGFWF